VSRLGPREGIEPKEGICVMNVLVIILVVLLVMILLGYGTLR
jgi:Tfp pilus assembly protein PilX